MFMRKGYIDYIYIIKIDKDFIFLFVIAGKGNRTIDVDKRNFWFMLLTIVTHCTMSMRLTNIVLTE